MLIFAVDTCREALYALVKCLAYLYPHSEISAFLDPLLAVKHGISHPPDAIYTAIRMRRMNGFEVVRMLQEDNARVTVNFLADDESDRQDAIRIGMNSYTVKPVTADKLRTSENEPW